MHGRTSGDRRCSRPHGSGREASKLIAGLAAGGIGALVRSSRSRSFEQATQEEPEAEMPPDAEPLPADAPAATDEVLHLLDAGRDRWAPGIAATLHQWHDIAALLAQVGLTANDGATALMAPQRTRWLNSMATPRSPRGYWRKGHMTNCPRSTVSQPRVLARIAWLRQPCLQHSPACE